MFITADTHFNHQGIIQFCKRPVNYEHRLEMQFARLPANSILFHLGDICMGNDAYVHERYIKPLVCKKILVKGNHDSKSTNWYLNHGWDFVCQSISDRFFGKEIILTHRPVAAEGYDLNIHGHLHNLGHHDGESMLIRNDKQRLYACEDFNYIPATMERMVLGRRM